MIKTPEEVKKGIKAHEKEDCRKCPYYDGSAEMRDPRIDPDYSKNILEDVKRCRDDLIADMTKLIAEQEERIAIMSEPDNLGGLFFEVLHKYAQAAKKHLPADGEEREAAEKALAKELSDYLSRALESGARNVPVFEITEGHCRMGVNKDENGGYIIVWFAAKEYKTPGEVAPPPEMATPVFGYKVRDAKHVRICAEAFTEIADKIEEKEGGKDGQYSGN